MKETTKGVKEKYSEIQFFKLLQSSDDLKIRREKFTRMVEVEKLGNKIWKLNLERTNLKTEITKLEKREREILGIPIIEINKDET